MNDVIDMHSRNVSELLFCALTDEEQRDRGRQPEKQRALPFVSRKVN